MQLLIHEAWPELLERIQEPIGEDAVSPCITEGMLIGRLRGTACSEQDIAFRLGEPTLPKAKLRVAPSSRFRHVSDRMSFDATRLCMGRAVVSIVLKPRTASPLTP